MSIPAYIVPAIYPAPTACYTTHTADSLLAAQRLLWVLCISTQGLLIGLIVHRRLLGAYPFFVAYLAFDTVYSLALLQVPFESLRYEEAFRIYQIVASFLHLAIAAELFEHLCRHFRQFRDFSQFRFPMAATLLVLTGVFFFAVFSRVPPRYLALLMIWVERWETAVLALSIALGWWLLTRFMGLRPQVRSNALAHGSILTAFFAINAACYALSLMAQGSAVRVNAVNLALLTGNLACLAAWLRYLRRDGELLKPELPPSPEALAYSRYWRRRILEYLQQAGR